MIYGTPAATAYGTLMCGPYCGYAAGAATIGAGEASISGGLNAAAYDYKAGTKATIHGAFQAAGDNIVSNFLCGVLDYFGGGSCA